MPVSIPGETRFFLYSMLYGAAFFFAYDILRCLRRVLVHNAFWVAVEDLAFWMTAGILLFLMVFDKNSGNYRSGFFLGIAAGLFFWYLLFDRLVLKAVTWFLGLLKKGIGKIFRIVSGPVVFLGKRSRWTVGFFFRKTKKASGTLAKHLKKCRKLVRISGKK